MVLNVIETYCPSTCLWQVLLLSLRPELVKFSIMFLHCKLTVKPDSLGHNHEYSNGKSLVQMQKLFFPLAYVLLHAQNLLEVFVGILVPLNYTQNCIVRQ